jgi:hypothetical protein
MQYTTGWNWYGGGVVINSISFAEQTGYTGASRGLIKKFTPNVSAGIHEESLSEGIIIYPNPAKDELMLGSSGFGDKSELAIYNSFGEKVFEMHLAEGVQHSTISVADFNSGIYFVRVKSESGQTVMKFVKE